MRLGLKRRPGGKMPERAILFCTFRMKYYFHRDADGERVIDRAEVVPRGVALACGHSVGLGPAHIRYTFDAAWPCHHCGRVLPGLVLRAVRAREAARHAAGRCVAACRLCFEAERG